MGQLIGTAGPEGLNNELSKSLHKKLVGLWRTDSEINIKPTTQINTKCSKYQGDALSPPQFHIGLTPYRYRSLPRWSTAAAWTVTTCNGGRIVGTKRIIFACTVTLGGQKGNFQHILLLVVVKVLPDGNCRYQGQLQIPWDSTGKQELEVQQLTPPLCQSSDLPLE